METITRFRSGGGLDENGDPIVSESPPLDLVPIGIAPGSNQEVDSVARDGESIEFTVYLPHGSDVVDGDELLIRGNRYAARVNMWRMQSAPSFGGLEVLAVMNRG